MAQYFGYLSSKIFGTGADPIKDNLLRAAELLLETEKIYQKILRTAPKAASENQQIFDRIYEIICESGDIDRNSYDLRYKENTRKSEINETFEKTKQILTNTRKISEILETQLSHKASELSSESEHDDKPQTHSDISRPDKVTKTSDDSLQQQKRDLDKKAKITETRNANLKELSFESEDDDKPQTYSDISRSDKVAKTSDDSLKWQKRDLDKKANITRYSNLTELSFESEDDDKPQTYSDISRSDKVAKTSDDSLKWQKRDLDKKANITRHSNLKDGYFKDDVSKSHYQPKIHSDTNSDDDMEKRSDKSSNPKKKLAKQSLTETASGNLKGYKQKASTIDHHKPNHNSEWDQTRNKETKYHKKDKQIKEKEHVHAEDDEESVIEKILIEELALQMDATSPFIQLLKKLKQTMML
jgi:hypothetical protein